MDVCQPRAWKQHPQTRVVQAGEPRQAWEAEKRLARRVDRASPMCERRRPVQTRTRLAAGPQRHATCCFSFASIAWRGTAPTIWSTTFRP